jgi:hypothetical protein
MYYDKLRNTTLSLELTHLIINIGYLQDILIKDVVIYIINLYKNLYHIDYKKFNII